MLLGIFSLGCCREGSVKQLFLQEDSVPPSLPRVVPSIYTPRVFVQVPSGCRILLKATVSIVSVEEASPSSQARTMLVLDVFPEQPTHASPWSPLSPGLEGATCP